MKVLITGGGGQLGRALVAVAPANRTIQAPTRGDLDITDVSAVHAAVSTFAPDLIINAAAYTAVDRAEREEVLAQRVNAEAVTYLAAAAQDANARLIHVSTDFVFDGASHRPYRPEDTPSPLGVYGKSKLAGELAALRAPGDLVVRTAWVYGAHGTNFVKTMLRLMEERDEVRVVTDQIGTPTHASALARSIWELATHDATGIFHATDAGVASWYDFAVAIQEEALVAGLLHRATTILPITTADYPTPAQRPAFSVLDKSKTWSLLGYTASHWRKELRIMLKELKDRKLG